MQESPPIQAGAELADAVFQAIITVGLAVFALVLYRRVRERWFAWWAAAWALYAVRLGAIITFLATGNLVWLFWHQVATGWVALAILWAALVFSRNAQWRPWYLSLAAFPLLWGWVAVNGLDRFHLAMAAIDRLPMLGSRAAQVKQRFSHALARHHAYVREHGEDLPEIRDWVWSGGASPVDSPA